MDNINFKMRSIPLTDEFLVLILRKSQDFSLEPVLPPLSARPDQLEHALNGRYHDALVKLQPERRELDLLIAILPDNNGSLYGMSCLLFFLTLCIPLHLLKCCIYIGRHAYSYTTF
jgi:hypothetical protein